MIYFLVILQPSMLIQLTKEQNTRIFIVNMAEDFKSPVHASQKLRSCNQCDFASVDNLKRQTLVHSARKPFKCIQCNYSFTNYANLKRHMLTHSGERCFKCNQCNNSFANDGTLKIHMLTYSGEKNSIANNATIPSQVIIVLRDTC